MQALRTAAFQLLSGNVKRGCAPQGANVKEYLYTCPARGVYHHQWLWDSSFHAFVMARFDGETAKAEMRTMLSGALPNGLLPHVITWQACSRRGLRGALARWLYARSHFANLTQPPVMAIALEEVYKRTEDRAFLQETLPAAKRYYDHLAEQRDPDGDGLLSIISPLESGMDHSPAFDVAMALRRISAFDYHFAGLKLTVSHVLNHWESERIFASDRFSVEDVSFNTIYALGLRSLAALCRETGDPAVDVYLRRAEETERALVERCYEPVDGLFYSLHKLTDTRLPVATVGSLMPLALPSLPANVARSLVENHLLRPDRFWLPYPIPSVSADQPTFSPSSAPLRRNAGLLEWLRNRWARHHLIWRGSTWINTNWFIVRGLRLHGYDEVADEITAATVELVERHGFWEYYNPYTGVGQGAEGFGWSTLVVDMIDETAPARLAAAMARRRLASTPASLPSREAETSALA